MTKDILQKLSYELNAGIKTEVQVVYVLAGVRKIIERDDLRDTFRLLNFHCDWALHSHLFSGAAAKAILKLFDSAHAHMRDGTVRLADLPPALRLEIDHISRMTSFEHEFMNFSAMYDLPTINKHRHDGWVHFLHLYSKVIEDIPLVVAAPTANDGSQHISSIVVHCEGASEPQADEYGNEHVFYRIRWTIHDKNGQSGEIFIDEQL